MITHNLPIAKPARKVIKKQTADLKDKISVVTSRISDAWSAAAAASNHVTLEEMRQTIARYDRVLSDLQDQERLAAEDATIYVKIKRKRSPSPSGERKRHCDWGQPNTCPKLTDRLASIATREEDAAADALEQTRATSSLHEVLQPKAGELYLALHKQSQLWLTALLLPLADLHTVGVSATIQSLGLSKTLPSCIVHNLDSEQFEWRDGYADGEASAHERKFPIAYFDGPEFPENSAVEWVAAKDLRILGESSAQSPIPQYHVVRAFLERRRAHRALRTTTGSLDPPLEYNEDCNTPNHASPDHQKTSITSNIPTTVHLDVREVDESQPVATRSSGFTPEHQLPNSSSPIMSSSRTSPLANPSRPQQPASQALLHILDTNALPEITGAKENPKGVMLPGPASLCGNGNGARFGLFRWPKSLPQRLIDLLTNKSGVRGVEPLPHDFKNGRGLLCCPFCSKIKEFVRAAPFTNHLLEKHAV